MSVHPLGEEARRVTVRAAAPTPCAECPWRVSNQGRRNPGHFYTKANLRRLWYGLRRGARMSCHPTDQRMNEWDHMQVPDHVATRECAGAVLIIQRELMIAGQYGTLAEYRRARPLGLTVAGARAALDHAIFGRLPGHIPQPHDLKLDDWTIAVPGLGEPE